VRCRPGRHICKLGNRQAGRPEGLCNDVIWIEPACRIHVCDKRRRFGIAYAEQRFSGCDDGARIAPDRGGGELSVKVVQNLLGHSSIVMTLDIYGQMFRDGGDRTELAEATRVLFA
jgi:integrase